MNEERILAPAWWIQAEQDAAIGEAELRAILAREPETDWEHLVHKVAAMVAKTNEAVPTEEGLDWFTKMQPTPEESAALVKRWNRDLRRAIRVLARDAKRGKAAK